MFAFAAVTVVGCASAEGSLPTVLPAPIAPTAAAQPERAPAPISAPSKPEAAVDVEVPPSWGAIYQRYLAPGTQGNCGAHGCHAHEMVDAASGYAWLAQRGYIAGTQSSLVMGNSCLRWFGGNMPPRGAANDEATRDLGAWVAAGAQNN
jgi:hypothetical protein